MNSPDGRPQQPSLIQTYPKLGLEKSLHQGGAEESGAFLPLETHPQGLFQGRAHRCASWGASPRCFHPGQTVAGIGLHPAGRTTTPKPVPLSGWLPPNPSWPRSNVFVTVYLGRYTRSSSPNPTALAEPTVNWCQCGWCSPGGHPKRNPALRWHQGQPPWCLQSVPGRPRRR